ncbi:MAG: orotidine-5'-phosphate decarboxylase [Myxococcota bacterium]
MSAARERLAFAADLPLEQAIEVYARIAPQVAFAKVGLSLFVEHGPRAVEAFLTRGAKVFLDLKLHDIPNTVELAASHAGALGASLLTVHASGGEAMLQAAVAGARAGAAKAGKAAPKVLAVTVLTSLSEADLRAQAIPGSAAEHVERLAALVHRAGVDGLVCSPREAAALRAKYGPDFFLCTPGIRPAGAEGGDQARTETPAAAIAAGADLLVVGRPIYEAPNPAVAARRIAQEVELALPDFR